MRPNTKDMRYGWCEKTQKGASQDTNFKVKTKHVYCVCECITLYEFLCCSTRNFDQNVCPVKGVYYANKDKLYEKFPMIGKKGAEA